MTIIILCIWIYFFICTIHCLAAVTWPLIRHWIPAGLVSARNRCKKSFPAELIGAKKGMQGSYGAFLKFRSAHLSEDHLPSLKLTAIWHLKNGWLEYGMLVSFWGPAYFQGLLLFVSGRVFSLGQNQPTPWFLQDRDQRAFTATLTLQVWVILGDCVFFHCPPDSHGFRVVPLLNKMPIAAKDEIFLPILSQVCDK